MSDFLTCRVAVWHFVRRVPSEFVALDHRGIIRHSTRVRISADPVGHRTARVLARDFSRERPSLWPVASRNRSATASI